jgi:predicted nuclease of predicted toxin-antitoxin system
MKLLLDECVTRNLLDDFAGHEVSTVEIAGLKGLKNGALLAAASLQFDVLITVDQNIRFQQNLTSKSISIVVLKAPRSIYRMLRPLIPHALAVLESITPGEIVVIAD